MDSDPPQFQLHLLQVTYYGERFSPCDVLLQCYMIRLFSLSLSLSALVICVKMTDYSLKTFHFVIPQSDSFYSASALPAMQSAVLARGILSVCPSVTFRYCV